MAQDPTEPQPTATNIKGHIITSPIVGTYYESSNPETPAFAEIGQRVKKGDVLCILEAMKIMNEIVSDVDGVITEIFASNGDMVEARAPLFRIEV
jgi:acetyl-CoA carboxylase biotin carboxyl carrier protein